MKGCRPLTDIEVARTSEKLLATRQGLRNNALFILGIKTGYRISELLSLRVMDVLQDGQILDYVTVTKSKMKKKQQSRTVPMHPAAKEALLQYLDSRKEIEPGSFLFKSEKGNNKPLLRGQAHKILKAAYTKAGITGNVATHSMRKTLATKCNNNIYLAQKVLGHRNIASTMSYIDFSQEEIDNVFLQ